MAPRKKKDILDEEPVTAVGDVVMTAVEETAATEPPANPDIILRLADGREIRPKLTFGAIRIVETATRMGWQQLMLDAYAGHISPLMLLLWGACIHKVGETNESLWRKTFGVGEAIPTLESFMASLDERLLEEYRDVLVRLVEESFPFVAMAAEKQSPTILMQALFGTAAGKAFLGMTTDDTLTDSLASAMNGSSLG